MILQAIVQSAQPTLATAIFATNYEFLSALYMIG